MMMILVKISHHFAQKKVSCVNNALILEMQSYILLDQCLKNGSKVLLIFICNENKSE